MRVSELSRRSGIPVATIKYYLREGLLHAGELTSATQARYDESHVARLGLIRALLGPARLSVEEAGRVLKVIDNPPETLLDVLGAAQSATAPAPPPDVDPGPALALMERLEWRVQRDGPELLQLATALRAAEDAEIRLIDGGMESYACAMHALAEREVDTVPTDQVPDAVRQAVLGTLLIEPVLLSLRRLAQQDVSTRRFLPDR
jgi:DNA-binding transcriptional MerR regulator